MAKSRVSNVLRCAMVMLILVNAVPAGESLVPPPTPGVKGVKATDDRPKIAHVFFAQTHVWASDHDLFSLIANREALIEVKVYSDKGDKSPEAFVEFSLNGNKNELPLKGPASLPKPPAADLKIMQHSMSDSFTATIPKEWVIPGLKVGIELREKGVGKKKGKILAALNYDRLNIGAPHKLILCMFDVHFFSEVKKDYPVGWLEELANKIPVSELELRRTTGVVFEKVVMVPRAGKPAVLCGSRKEYEEKTGIKFDGEQDLSGTWIGALKHAAGQNGAPQRLFYLNIFGVPGGGEAGGFTGVGQGGQQGLFLHELGHALGLPHWGTAKSYPYRGNMLGIMTKSGDKEAVHVGPTWAYDHTRHTFIPPINSSGRWKVDPMQGGGTGDQETPFLYNHFSDYSIHKITKTLDRMISYDETAGVYVKWNHDTKSYAPDAGKKPPISRNVDVIAILAAASGVTPEANIVYPPFGAHKSDLLDIYEVSSPADRARAKAAGYSDATCNVCMRITQGGKTLSFLLKMKIDSSDDPLDEKSLKTIAINISAKNGEVTQVDLLYAPEVISKGLSPAAKVLHSWKKRS